MSGYFQAAHSQTTAPVTTLVNQTVCAGNQAVVPITVKGFTNTTAVNLQVEFDPAQLQFVGGTPSSLLDGMLINTVPVRGGSTLHKVILVWASSIPKTLPDNDTLASLTFTALSGPATLSFNNIASNGSNCEFGDATAEPMTDVPTENYYFIGTVTLQTLSANPFATDTLSLCGSSQVLNAGNGYATYQWNTGETTQNKTVAATGLYRCTVSDGVCAVTDSVFVSLVDAYITQNDTTLFPGEGVMLQAQNLVPAFPGLAVTYHWSNGLNQPAILAAPAQTTTFYCTVSNGLSSCTDSVRVTIKDLPADIFATDTLISCTNTYLLDAGPGYTGYLWNTGASAQTLSVNQSAWYVCTISVGTHSLTDSVYVLIDTQPRYFCELRNDVQTSPNTYEFDIYLLGDNACVPLELASASYGITLNPAIRNGGSITASIVAGSSALNSNQVPTSITFTSSQNCIKISPRSTPPAGSGTLIPNTGQGIRVCRVKLTNSVTFAPELPNLNWSFAATPYASKVNAFLGGVNTVLTADATTHTTHHLVNPLLADLVAPISISISNDTLCGGNGSVIFLSIEGGTGTIAKWYTQSCGGILIGTGSFLAIPAPEVSTTFYARWEMGSNATACLSTHLHIIPSVPVAVAISEDQNHLCEGMPVTITASLTNGGPTPALAWYRNNELLPVTDSVYTYTPAAGIDAIKVVLTSSVEGCKSNNPATSNTLLIYVDNPPKPSSVKLFLEGLYNASTGSMNAVRDASGFHFADTVADELFVQLANTAYPYAISHSFTGRLMTDGTLNFPTPCSLTGNYYLVVKPRNHLEIWSAEPVSFSGTTIDYDFTTSDGQAYGQNMKQLAPGVWGLWAGDVWGDGSIDDLDMEAISEAANGFEKGYTATDLNGDGVVDALDLILIDNNMAYMIWVITP